MPPRLTAKTPLLARWLAPLGLAVGAAGTSAAIDLGPLWDFQRPDVSEQRFRTALQTAEGDDALILQTQIARTYGLRGEFAKGRELLRAIEPQVRGAGPEVRARFGLEMGRTLASAAHAPDAVTPQDRQLARAAYEAAFETARAARLDGLAVDALHMQAFVDTAPAEQLVWDRRALALVEASDQPAAKRWEASIRNNLGEALHDLGRDKDALIEFQRALALRERGTDAEAIRSARWAVAWIQRALGMNEVALAAQLRLATEMQAAGAPDADVYKELEILFRQRGDEDAANRYALLWKALAH